MSTWVLAGPSFDASHEVLRSVTISSTTTRSRSADDYWAITPRVRRGDFFTPLGSWSQIDNNLKAGVSRELLDARHRPKRLKAGQTLEVHIEKIGSPSDIVGAAVEFIFDRVGGDSTTIRPLIAVDDPAPESATIQRFITQFNRIRWDRRVLVGLVEGTA